MGLETAIIQDALAQLQGKQPLSCYLGTIGDLRVEARVNEHDLLIGANLGSGPRPTRAQVMEMLLSMERFYHEITLHVPEFATFVSGYEIGYEIFVFSGPMDFTVATRRNGRVSWETELD